MRESVAGLPHDFWHYLSETQKDLIKEGFYLRDQINKDSKYSFHDYSFLVFPFAKCFEGYLKQVFLDCKFITQLDYISTHFRLGRLLSPYLAYQLGQKSLYHQVKQHATKEFAEELWMAWKLYRNEIFHYYPHNYKSISIAEADDIIYALIRAMKEVYNRLITDDK